VIRVQAPSVVVDVIVTDRHGRPVRGLTADQFRVFEDKAEQQITGFEPPPPESPTLPGSPSPPAAKEPAAGAAPSAGQALAERLGSVRFVTVVIDLANIHPANRKPAMDAAVNYIGKILEPSDYVAVYWIGERLHLAVPYTLDRARAADVLGQLGAHVESGSYTAEDATTDQIEIDRLDELQHLTDNPQLARLYREEKEALRGEQLALGEFQGRASLASLRAIAQAAAALPGRKNVVVFSEGFLTRTSGQSPNGAALAAVIDAANRANVACYFVDPSGLSLGQAGRTFSSLEQGASYREPDGTPSIDTMASEMNLMSTQGTELRGGLDKFDSAALAQLDIHDALADVAYATGGLLIKDRNDLLAGLKQVDLDLRDYYTLVYQPQNTAFDGSLRRIRVELASKGYTLRYRRGYFALPPGGEITMTPAAAQLISGVANHSIQPQLPAGLNAALLFDEKGNAAVPVMVSMPGRLVKFTRDQNRYSSGVTLVVSAWNAEGKLQGVKQRFFNLDLDESQWKQLQNEPLEVTARLAPPAFGPLRVQAILELSGGQVGVAERNLAPAGADSEGPQLTSILLSDQVSDAAGHRDPQDPLRVSDYELGLPPAPRFKSIEKLTVCFGVRNIARDHASGQPHFDLSFQIESRGRVVRTLPAKTIQFLAPGAPNRMQVLRQYDLAGLPPGDYTLEVTSEDQVSGRALRQSADFVIE
jgi:VWFA-related protein